MLYVDEGLIIHDTFGPSAWIRLNTRRQELSSYEEWSALTDRDIQRLVALSGSDCQLIGVNRAYSVEDWALRLVSATPRPNPGFEAELRRLCYGDPQDEDGRGRLQDYSAGKEVYLGVRLSTSTQQAPAWKRWLGLDSAEHWLGIEDPRPNEKWMSELKGLQKRALQHALVGGLGARLASADELRWLLRRTYWRNLTMPAGEPRRAAWGGEAHALLDGAYAENHYGCLRVLRRDGQEFWVSTLGFNHLPDQLGDGGRGEMSAYWLHLHEELDFPVEFQVRFRVLPRQEAIKAVESVTARVRDQYQHVLEIGEDAVPRALEEQHQQVDDVEHSVKILRQTFLRAWPRLVVAGESKEELQDRVQQVVDHLHDELDITAEVPTGAQRSLFYECIPGLPQPAALKRLYPQEMALRTLAGSGALSATSLGDQTGPYWGPTGQENTPVHVDPHLASRADRAGTLMVFAGVPGSGKSVLMMKNVYWERLRGASVSLLAPEGVPVGFLKLCRQEGEVWVLDIADEEDELGGQISLDPFRFLPPGDAAQLAASYCQTMLSVPHAGDIDIAFEAAAGDIATEMGDKGSLTAVLDRAESAYASSAGVVPAARSLRNLSRQPVSRALFRQSERRLDLQNALTVLKFHGLQLPSGDMPRADWSPANRVATAAMQGMIALQSRLSDVGGVNHPKMAVYDDCQPVLVNPYGRSVITAMVLRGRKKHETPLVISQNVSHLFSDSKSEENTLLSNCAIACVFRLPDRNEAIAGCRLLRIEATEENIRAIQTLGPNREPGHPLPFSVCLLRDLDGNVGEVQIDIEREDIQKAFSTTPGLEVVA